MLAQKIPSPADAASQFGPVTEIHWRHLLPVFAHPYRAYLDLHRRFGAVLVSRPPGGELLCLCADEQLAAHLLSERSDALIRPPDVTRKIFELIVGGNIVASEGETWRGKRRRGTRRLAALHDEDRFRALQRCLVELIDELRVAIGSGARVDLLPFIERFTLRAAVRLVSEVELDPQSREFTELLAAMRQIMHSTQRLADLRKQAFAYALVPGAEQVVDRRRRRRLEAAVAVVAAFERDPELAELLMAGYENPSTTLTWALTLLGSQPRARAWLRAEARRLSVIDGSAEALEGLTRAEAATRETVRMRPPIAYLAREVQTELRLGELVLPVGSDLIVVPYCLHMNPAIWPQPERFEPQRFVAGDGARGRLWSFGVGPRACVGTRYALSVVASAISAIAREFEWEPVPGRAPPAPSGRFPWSEKIGCWVTIRPCA